MTNENEPRRGGAAKRDLRPTVIRLAAKRGGMPIRAYCRKDLALAQLETALRLYFEASDFGSVITLAGAADEIFGKLLEASGKESSLAATKKAASAIYFKLYGEPLAPREFASRANQARNSLKHWDVGDSQIVKLDLAKEAGYMLLRAIDNYWMLEENLSPTMERFQREKFLAEK